MDHPLNLVYKEENFKYIEKNLENFYKILQISASLYKDLAKLTRAFCPPERATPLSPTIVLSPYGSCLKSSSSEQTRIISSYFILLNCFPNIILCLSEPGKIQVSCDAYESSPFIEHF